MGNRQSFFKKAPRKEQKESEDFEIPDLDSFKKPQIDEKLVEMLFNRVKSLQGPCFTRKLNNKKKFDYWLNKEKLNYLGKINTAENAIWKFYETNKNQIISLIDNEGFHFWRGNQKYSEVIASIVNHPIVSMREEFFLPAVMSDWHDYKIPLEPDTLGCFFVEDQEAILRLILQARYHAFLNINLVSPRGKYDLFERVQKAVLPKISEENQSLYQINAQFIDHIQHKTMIISNKLLLQKLQNLQKCEIKDKAKGKRKSLNFYQLPDALQCSKEFLNKFENGISELSFSSWCEYIKSAHSSILLPNNENVREISDYGEFLQKVLAGQETMMLQFCTEYFQEFGLEVGKSMDLHLPKPLVNIILDYCHSSALVP